jgi:hypothetical protein
MHADTFQRYSFRFLRRGVATLEFVMALPLLFVLMLCVMFVGFWGIGQTEVIVEARNKAWQRRFEDASKKPLYFPILKGLYEEESDYVTEKASQRVDISPAFSGFPQPEASHTILAGSWDYAAMSLREPPNVKLMAVAAGIGLLGPALDKATLLDDPLGLVKEFANAKSFGDQKRQETENQTSQVGKGHSNAPDGPGGGSVPGSKGDESSAQGEAATKAEQEKEKRLLIERYKALGGQYQAFGFQAGQIIAESGELRQAFDQRAELQSQALEKQLAASRELDPDKKKQLQAEADRLDRKADVADIRFKRLHAEAHEIVKELRAVGMNEFEISQL